MSGKFGMKYNPEDIRQARKFLDETKQSFVHYQRKRKEVTEQLEYVKDREEGIKKARIIIQTVAQETQKNLEYHLSDLVTSCLHAVFPDNIKFVVNIEMRRGKTECDLLFEEFDKQYKPLEGSGFGPVDVASFALRVCFWSLKKNRPVFILDEPFRNVSPDLQNKVSAMVKKLSDKLGIQIIMVSHQEEINVAADKTFLSEKHGQISTVNEIK